MDIPSVYPRALKSGDTIRIVAPAGPVDGPDGLLRGVAMLERAGFRVRYDDRIFESRDYLAGSDERRAEELMRAFEDTAVDAVLPLRGGYGCSRLVPLLDEKRLRSRCKLFMGFSDITTLHLYFRRRFGWITVHGPMATSAALAEPGKEEGSHLLSLVTDPSYRPRLSFPGLETWRSGVAQGRLTGGCLSIIVASLGTPYEIRTRDRILFLEDLGEPPYRVDRMLTQLRLAGKLKSVAGILLGDFRSEPEDAAVLKECLRSNLIGLDIPVLANFPSGHGPENWAIPMGASIRIDAGRRTVEFLEAAVK